MSQRKVIKPFFLLVGNKEKSEAQLYVNYNPNSSPVPQAVFMCLQGHKFVDI